ncbi:MAG: ubiquinol-cytochrome c reductase iron-sulfur subunit [Pyrinomonadaceae bacterium]|nr:ubiquinol-cytochrome c reductase iron-sulfur subunit [Pyrinomonadaceae bacterium]
MKINLVRTTVKIPSYQSDPDLDELRDAQPPDSGGRAELAVSDERRSFLGLLTGLIGAGISGVLGITLGRFSIAPALSASNASEWIDVAPLAEIPEGKPTNRSLVVSQNAGWGHFSSDQSVWVVKKAEQLTVFSSVCPHLGCTITENAGGFGCVCHNSAWNGAGEKLSGPAPRGMDTLEHKVESNVVRVRYQNFKQGVAEKSVAS